MAVRCTLALLPQENYTKIGECWKNTGKPPSSQPATLAVSSRQRGCCMAPEGCLPCSSRTQQKKTAAAAAAAATAGCVFLPCSSVGATTTYSQAWRLLLAKML